MKRLLTALFLPFIIVSTAVSGDLYRIDVDSPSAARALREIGPDVLMQVENGYLVLADESQSSALRRPEMKSVLLAAGVSREELVLDARRDGKNAARFEVIFEEGQLRLLRIEPSRLSLYEEPPDVFPLPESRLEIEYRRPSGVDLSTIEAPLLDDLQVIVDRVRQDSLLSYVRRLQSFYRRVAGTESNWRARDWIAGKFEDFGYDTVEIDPFIGSQLWARTNCQAYNVIAYKPGVLYPEQHIIIGGHFDAVPDCPGADDNASGTAAVLECARVLQDIPTAMSFVFVAFDSEESGLFGSYHYVDEAIARDEHIVLMINCDMIGHYQNSDKADLYTGIETAYATLWDQMGNTYSGIDADLAGMAASDHWPFQQKGYDVLFVQEKIFSTYYHTVRDSTTYMNFDYMTRMVRATVATAFAANEYVPPVRISSIKEPGDGQSQRVYWHAINSGDVTLYRLSYYPVANPSSLTSIDLPLSDTTYLIEGLADGNEYGVFVRAFNGSGATSLVFDESYFVPRSLPAAPSDLLAMPLRAAVSLSWNYSNAELDFDHCSVLRDGEVICETLDTFCVDSDTSLGNLLHDYRVVAVDADGNLSDTLGIEAVPARAATLEPGRILAVNRSHVYAVDFVDETETGTFMREALDGYDFDYFSDTAAVSCRSDCVALTLNDMLDYEIVVIGAETGHSEDIGVAPVVHGILDTLAYYMSLGGKAVMFGRWGVIGGFSVVNYMNTEWTYDDPYHDIFHINRRLRTPTTWDYVSPRVLSDFIGARTTISTYPHLLWDSLATVRHANSQPTMITEVSGIPCATYVDLDSSAVEILYTYNSRVNDPLFEGQPVAWRYFGDIYAYVCFDLPLSFFDRTASVAALRQAVDELLAGQATPGDPPDDPPEPSVPETFRLSQNFPNPFNPSTTINFSLPKDADVKLEIFNVLGQKVATLVDRRLPAGQHEYRWQGESAASGIYLYRLKADGLAESKKMVLVR